jgi:hypothetical protein
MKKLVGALALTLFTAPLFAYQVTGPVISVDDKKIVVEKDGEKWELAMTADTKGGKPKVGDKVTIEYSMTAKKIEVKGAAAADKGGKKK